MHSYIMLFYTLYSKYYTLVTVGRDFYLTSKRVYHH